MKPRLTTLALALLSTAALHAEDTAPAAAKVAPYQLQRKSAFAATDASQRAPFWPIGWTRKEGPKEAMVALVPKVTLDEKAFKISSISLGNPSLAIINGRSYSEGESIRQPRATGGAATVSTTPLPPGTRITVYRISDGSVTLQHQEQLLTVMLHRTELQQRRGEEELLSEDRP